jgi:hypothetical protein
MEPATATSLDFAAAARALAEEGRRRGLRVPAFRSPPGLPVDRSIRRLPDGGAVVAVRFRDRPLPDVLADLVEGVLVANGLGGPSADQLRAPLLQAAVTDVRASAA